MSDPIHYIRVLHNNPFIFASAFVSFFEALGEKENSLLLAYLVLPVTLNSTSRKFLQNANSRSSLRTMLHNRGHVHGLDERVSRYREMTNLTVQYLLANEGISINSQLVVTNKQPAVDGTSPEGVTKAAHRLGTFFQPYDVPTIFRMVGVMFL